MKKQTQTLLAGVLFASPVFAIDIEQMEIYGYGVVSYSSYDYLKNYQSQPQKRAKVDFERFVLSPRFLLEDNIKLVSEIEFEHGGTGATMEYDTLEEFGEFETEIEKGGEVVVEEAYLDMSYQKWLNFRVGHMVIPIGLNTQRHLPTLQLSSARNISETTILPDTWHETGVMIYGKLSQNLNYSAMVMTGLNSEFFDSSHWIKNGDQKQFEFANADSLAFALRVDYGNPVGSHIGASIYMGNTGDNRNKAQLDVDGSVTITEVHGVYDEHNIKLRALALYGTLSDSEKITLANRGLPNALEAKRTPVGSAALAYFIELGYDLSPLVGYSKSIVPFIKYDFVDSMYKTEGFVQDLDRYERTTSTFGIDYFFTQNIVFKMDYANTSFADNSLDDLGTFTLSAGYQF